MTPRESLEIVAAAMRWSTVHERRKVAVAAKRIAGDRVREARSFAERDAAALATSAAGLALTEAKRQERAALRSLAKLCLRMRKEQASDVLEFRAPVFALQHDGDAVREDPVDA